MPIPPSLLVWGRPQMVMGIMDSEETSTFKGLFYGALWVVITLALITAGFTSMVFVPESTTWGPIDVYVFWISLALAAVGLFLQARWNFYAFCQGGFFYALITAIITGAVVVMGRDGHPVAATIAVLSSAFALFSLVYMIVRKPAVQTSVYDKAKWYFDSVQKYSLPQEQAYIHGGMFLAWMIEAGLHSEFFAEEMPDSVKEITSRKRTGPKILEEDWDGGLDAEMFDDSGNAFARWYYEGDSPSYNADFEDVLCGELPSNFHVEDTWENYGLLKACIDQRFKEWQRLKRQGS